MDGKNQEVLLESSNNLTISMVQSMVVDPQTSTLYWADSSADHIGRLHLIFLLVQVAGVFGQALVFSVLNILNAFGIYECPKMKYSPYTVSVSLLPSQRHYN